MEPQGHAISSALESVIIAYPTTSSQFAPLWFTRDVGIYEKYGIDGKLVFIQGGSVLLQAMIAGQAMKRQCEPTGRRYNKRIMVSSLF